MSQVLAENILISPQEYFEGEHEAELKHEYIDGEVYAMAGASDAHVAVSGNAFSLLKNHLRGSECRTYIADMKVAINNDEAYFYPDVMVCCEAEDQQAEQNYVKKSPKLIIEVLSPSTEANDRGKKFILYRNISSLEEYILIDPREYYIEQYSRQSNEQWVLSSYNKPEAIIKFTSIDYRCELVDLYEDVVFEQESPQQPSEETISI